MNKTESEEKRLDERDPEVCRLIAKIMRENYHIFGGSKDFLKNTEEDCIHSYTIRECEKVIIYNCTIRGLNYKIRVGKDNSKTVKIEQIVK